MHTKLTAPLRHVLSPQPRRGSDVHFHADGAGRPFVCDYARCESARLSAAEVRTAR